MNTTPATLESLTANHRFERQIALVRHHWKSHRNLWQESSDPVAARRIRANVPTDWMLGCGLVGLARVEPMGGRFEFAEEGRPAMILGVYDAIPGLLGTNARLAVEHILDLVAVDLDRPERFWRYSDRALVLGLAYLEIARQEGEPVPVYRNPLTWLRSGGDGIVVLDWAWAWDLLLGLDLIAEDVDLGNRLEAALKPDIWVMEAAA